MTSTVFTEEFSSPEINRHEILRYMGVKDENCDINALLDSCLNEVMPILKYKICSIVSDISLQAPLVNVADLTFESKSLSRHFIGCDRAVIFSSTLGIGIDRCISRYSRISPARAFCIQSIGAERIESLCNFFCNSLKDEYGNITSRFSPGYGDLDINVQKDILSLLNSAKNIGLTLNDSMIMSPSKSVTALVGIIREE